MFGLLKKYNVNLCPEVKGRITLKGEPVSGLKITRSLTYYYGKEQLDYATTDDNGCFSFPEVNIRSSKPGSMFDVSRTIQEITVQHDSNKHLLWLSVFHGIENRSEYKQKLTSLNAELTNESVQFEFKNQENPHRNFDATSIGRW